MDENRKRLYDQLSAQWDMGTFDEFDTDLDNEENQKVAWQAVGGQDGYGDFDLFKQAIQRSPMQPEQQPTMPAVTASEEQALPEPPQPSTPKDPPAEDTEIINQPADKADTTPATLAEETVETETAQPVDYSQKSDEELMRDMGVMPGHELTQRDIDSRMTWIETLADPAAQQAELDKLNQSITEWNRRASAKQQAERIASTAKQRQGIAEKPSQTDPNETTRYENYNRLVSQSPDWDGKSQTSPAQRGISRNPQRYNRNIERVRTMNDQQLDEGFAAVMDSTAYRSDEERAVDAVPYVIEKNARHNGQHAQTMGEEVAREYLNQHPELKESYEHWKGGDEGYRSDIDKDPAAATEVAPFAIAGRVVSAIDRKIREINRKYTDEISPDPRKPIPGGVLRDPSGAQLSAMQRRIYDLAEVGNLTRMVQEAIKSYDPILLNSYIAAFAEKENTDIPSAKNRVASIILQKVREDILSRMTPDDNAAYATYALFGNTFVGNILKAGLALMTSNPGETTIFGLDDEALAKYGATHNHWWDQVVRGSVAVGTLMIDAQTIGFTAPSWFGGLAGRMVANRVGNVFLDRLFTSAVSGAVNFGTFEAQAEWVSQLKTGERNLGKIITAFGSGMAKGAAFGTVGSTIDRLFWSARGWVVPFSEAVKILGETATFSGIGYLETGKLTAEDWGTNFGMVMSGKAKDPAGYIRDVQARMEGKRYLPKINRISKEYAETLSQKGYATISSILRTGRLGREQLDGLDNELIRMRSDNTVPWETLRMAEYALNGHLYPSPPAAKVRIDRGEDSTWTFTPTDNDGRAVGESITVKGTEAKKELGAKFAHEIEKNTLLIKETASWDASVDRQVGKAVLAYCQKNVEGDASSVYKTYMEAQAKLAMGAKLGDVERDIYHKINEELKKTKPTDDVAVYKAETKRAGYDLDKIIRKPASERSEQERIALSHYVQWLDGREVDARDLNEHDFNDWAERAPEVAAANSARIAREYEQKAEGLRTHIDELRGSMDMGNVVVLEHVDQVTDAQVRQQIERSERMGEKGVPGWYDESTDTTYVYLPHAESIEDLDRTIMHEQVTHHGLRVLKTQGYNDLCDRVWNSMSDAERSRWENYAGVRDIEDKTQRQRAAADEYIAHLAERTDPESAGLWSRFVAWAKEGMRKLGIRTDRISDAELEQIIRESYRNLREQRGERAERVAEGEPEHVHEDRPDDGVVPPDDGGTPPPDAGETPPAAEGGETPAGGEPPVERPTAAVGRVEGTPADIEDWRELMTLDPDELDSSQVTEGLSLLEAEREQAHRYANGELADEPSNWEYWAARDGLSAPENPGGTPPVGGGGEQPVDGGGRTLARPKARGTEPKRKGSLPKVKQNEPRLTEQPGEPVLEPERPALSEKPLNELTAEELDGEITRLMEYFDGGGQDADGSLDRRLSELYAEQSRREEEEVKEPVEPQEPVGDDAPAEAEPRPTEPATAEPTGAATADATSGEQRGETVDAAVGGDEPRGPQLPERPQLSDADPASMSDTDIAAEIETLRGYLNDARTPYDRQLVERRDALYAEQERRLQQVDEDAERRAAQESDPYYMPMENKGGGRMSPNWRKATAEQIFNHLNDRENASGRDTLDGNIADGVKRAEDKLKAVERREPKGKGRSDTALDKWEKELSEARAQLEKWREVERMRREQKAADGDDSDPTWKQAYDEFNSSDEEPVNLEDYVARHLYGTKFKWKDKEFENTGGRTHGLGGHLGLSKSDKERRGFFGWIDEKNGSYPESVAEGLYANMPDWMRERYDTMEVLDAVLSVVGSNPRPRDMVVDYVKRLREQNRDMDEYYADEAAGARGFHDAGEMDAYDNMREREAAGFHDVAAAGREADGARADLLADAQARLNDPNASEYEKQAARTVLRFRQRGGRGGASPYETTEGEGVRFRVVRDPREVELNTPGGEVMHSVDVTDEMRQSVQQGQPLFRVRERDKEYAEAVAAGDKEKVDRMLREEAERKGYQEREHYQDAHGAPSAEVDRADFRNLAALRQSVEEDGFDANVYALANGISMQPDDYWSARGPRLYMYDDQAGHESAAAIVPAIRSIQYQMSHYGEVRDMPKVKVYRTVPNDIKGEQLEGGGGQWVSPSRTYAEKHGLARFGEGEYRIIEQEVPADELWWDGNDAREWGYDDGTTGNVYQNTANNRKLLEPTYDDAGNLIPLSERFDRSKSDVRYRFVGERGAGRADAADRGGRMKNRDTAAEMERAGKDARSIKLATGWERGRDGKWRHEERDFDEVDYYGNLRWYDDNPEAKRLRDLRGKSNANIFAGGEPLTPEELEEYNSLSEKYRNIDFSKTLRNPDRLTLEDFVRDERLFSAYPELKGVKVRWSDDLPSGTAGDYNESRKTIRLNPRNISNAIVMGRTLAHEVQHAIQAMEGFAKGGNPWMRQSEVGLHDSERYTEVTQELISVLSRLNELDREINKLLNHYNRIPWRGGSEERKQVNARLKPLERERIELIDRRNELWRERKELEDKEIGYDTYRRLAGEVEARNVSKRMDMSDEQRRGSLAEDTEDVPRDEQLVRFGNGVSMEEVRDDILDFFHKAARGEVSGHGKSIGKLTKEGKDFLEQVSGMALKDDIDFVLNPSDLRHIYREHYGSNEKDPGNNKPLTDEDIRNIASVSTQPERVVFGINKKTGNKVFIFLSSNPDGTYNLAEVYTDRRGNLTAKSFYNTKKTISQRVNELLTSSPRLTSATEGASPSSGTKVPKLFEPLRKNNEKNAETTGNGGVSFRYRGGVSGETADHTTAVEEARRRLESVDASEFEKQAARAVIKAYGGGSDDTPGGGVRFRTRDDADMLVDMAKHNNELARQARDAVVDFVKAITDVDELTDSKFATALGKVMRGQRQYDQETVADITDMVKAMMDAGLLTELDNFAVKQILTKVKDSTGKNDITGEANKLIDIMLKNQLRRGKRAFEQQLKVKGMKQDSRGVVVQGGLDYHGQRAAKALKEGLSLGDLDTVNDRIAEAEQRLTDPDETVRGNAADELDGLYIARQYYDEIKQSELNEANVKAQLEQAKTDHKNGTMTDEAYRQFRQACDDALRELRCERVDAWSRLTQTLGDQQGESAERAKQFREQQKQRQEEIQHWANSDMEGHSADPHERETRKKTVGDTLRDWAQAALQPLGTFAQLMRYFGQAYPKGEGYLFNFVRRFMNLRDQWFKERKADFDQMDTAARRIAAAHGARVKAKLKDGTIVPHAIRDWADVYTYIRQQPKLTVTVKGKDYQITQGNAAYLLAMEAQTDGRMKLRAMGLTEAAMDALRNQVDPMLLNLSHWVVNTLLPGMRPRLNQTHIRMFGADMTDIPNYFPIRTSELSRNETVNLAQQGGKIRPATITGSIVERKRNNLDLDLSADLFQVTAEHIDEMNHWNNFAEYARDLNTLLSYKRFRAQVNNLHSWRYGNGSDIWQTLEATAAITTGDYQAKTSKADAVINGASQGLAAANITYRWYTGLKQLLSSPVYLIQARWDDLGYALSNPKGTWDWAIKNLPTFAERWQGRMAGDPILTQAEAERGTQNKKLRAASKWGFAFNAAIDAMTVAAGARAIYRTKYRRYQAMGYSEEQSKQKALEDASISVNETQQSGLGAFTSVIQQDRTLWSRVVTLYRNASMGYGRQLANGLKAMRNGMSQEWRAAAREKVQKKLERDGIDPAMAAKVADRLVNREATRGLAVAAMFGSIAPFVWSLGAQYLGYKMAGGDDDETESKMLVQSSTHLASGWLEGIVGGATISSLADFAYDYYHGRKKLRDYSLQHDLLSDMAEQIIGKSSGKPADAAYDIVNMLVAMGTGVNPKSIVEPTVGIIDVVQNWNGDAALAHEIALGWCRLLNVPQTSLDQVYIDEIGLTAKDAKELTAEQFAERWCRYKRRRGAGYMSPLTSEESDKEQEQKLLQRYERMMDERFESLSDERVESILRDSDDELLKKHATKAHKSRIAALTDDDVAAAVVPLSDSAPRDSVDTKREGIKRAYKAEGVTYSKPQDNAKNALTYERRATYADIAEDAALKGRHAALKETVGKEFEDMGAEYRDGSQGWGWYIADDARASAAEIHAYKQAHEADLEEYGILSWWFGNRKGSSGSIKKGLTDGKHAPAEVMQEYREARKRVLSKTRQR